MLGSRENQRAEKEERGEGKRGRERGGEKTAGGREYRERLRQRSERGRMKLGEKERTERGIVRQEGKEE